MDLIAFINAVNQLEACYGVHIPANSRTVAEKIFQVYGEYLSVAEGALGLLRHASINLVNNLDSDFEETMLELEELSLDRAFVELKELERDLNSHQSFYLPHVRKEYNRLEEKWEEFVRMWLPLSVDSFQGLEDRVDLLFQLHVLVTAITSQQHLDQISLQDIQVNTIIDELGRTFHDDYRQDLVVHPNMIIEFASSMVRTPPSHLARQLNLPREAAGTPSFGTLIGLDHIVCFIVEAISKKKPSGRPLGSFLLLGKHGRGKTELARALSKQLFDHEDMLVICDMSDYQDANSRRCFCDDLCGDTLLGKLLDISRRNAYGVLMFVNIEKASSSVMEIIVTILREGIFKNCEGTLVDLTAVLVLMKSNVGNDVFQIPCRCLDKTWKVKQILSGHQRLQIEHKNKCYYMPFLEKTSTHFSPEFLDHLDEVLVLPCPSPFQYSEIARIQLRKLIPEMLNTMQKKVLVYLSQAALEDISIIDLMDNGGHASKKWLEKEIIPRLQKCCGDGIEEPSIVYVDVMVGTCELSWRVENIGYLLNDRDYGRFKETLSNLRKVQCRNRRIVRTVYKLGTYAHDIPCNARSMLILIDQLLREACDGKQKLENIMLFLGEEERQGHMMIEKKAKYDVMDSSARFYYKFVEPNQTCRILLALLESMVDVIPTYGYFQRPRSVLFLGLERAGREDLTVGLSKCYAPGCRRSPIVEVDLSLCTEPDSFIRCTCKGKSEELFVDAIRAMPKSIIVFYNLEIAHISVFSNILTILDHGLLYDNNGADVDFRNSVILFVSSSGNREVISALFGVCNHDKLEDTREGLRFRMELLNRLDEIVFFFPFRLQQFDVVQKLAVRFGLPMERRREFSTVIHDIFYSGKIMDVQKRSASCLKRLLTKVKVA